MADPTTVNKQLAQPVHNTDVDVWAPIINNNTTIIDNSFGGVATVALTSAAVTLASSQYSCVFLHFTGALTANVAVTLPAVGSFYTIINDTTNSSAFIVTLKTTVAGSKQIGVPQDTTEIFTDGTDVRFRALPYVGAYWKYSGSSVPAWVSACTVPPWLTCDGTAFSSATYPTLAVTLNSTTLPDLRGRTFAFYNDGTGRLNSSQGGVDGNTLYSAGGSQSIIVSSVNLPNINFPVTDTGHAHTNTNNANSGSGGTTGGTAIGGYVTAATITINSAFTGIHVYSGGSGAELAKMPPSVAGGIMMIRAG